MKIRELMKSNVVTVREDTLAKDVYELMRTRHLRHLPVVNRENQLVGIVSDRDILNVTVVLKKRPQSPEEYLIDDKLTTRDVMTVEPATVSPDDDLGQALDLILSLAISSLPVIEDGKLVGIVTNTDMLHLLKKLSKDPMTSRRSLDDYISAAHHLVPAPQVLPQILPLLNQPDADTNAVVDLIAYNQTLTGNVHRVCNSAYFSSGTPIDSLQQAVTRVGFRQIYDIVVSVISSLTLARPQKGYGVEANELWGHSVATAVAAQIVARDCAVDQQIVFTAAILHDIGKIVLSLALEDLKDKVAFETETYGLSPYEIEMKLLGVNHAEIGGRLLEHWKLPEHLVAGVRYHHHPAGAKGNERLAACVYLGNSIAYLAGYGYGKHSLDLKARAEALEILNLTSESIPQYTREIQQTHRLLHFKDLYGLK